MAHNWNTSIKDAAFFPKHRGQFSPATLTHWKIPMTAYATEPAQWFYNTRTHTLNPHAGGFNPNPPVDLSRNPVYMRSNADNSAALPVVNINNIPGASQRGYEMLPSYLELKGPCSNSRDGTQIFGEYYSTYPPCHPQHGFQTAVSSSTEDQLSYHKMMYNMDKCSICHVSVREDPAALVSNSADKELERLRHKGAPQPTSQRSDFIYDASSKLLFQGSPFKKQSPAEYMERIEMISTETTDRGIIQAQPEYSKNLIPVEEKSQDQNQGLGCEHCVGEQASESFTSMDDDESILSCKKRCKPGPLANTETEAPVESNETRRRAVLRDVTVNTELVECMSVSTQTVDQVTFERGINTDVYMFDLDYQAEELMRLKKSLEGRDQNEIMKSTGMKFRREFDVQRAQRVDLCVLALQYNMCRQHCWRLYSTCIELSPIHGDMSQYWPKEPPLNIASALQKLDSDYKEMKDKILAGVPLERLTPLSVDSEKIITGTSYIPELTTKQIIGEVLGNVPPWSPQQTPEKSSNGSNHATAAVPNTVGCQDDQQKNAAHQHKDMNCKASRSVAVVPQQWVPSAHKTEEKQSKADACKGHSPSEVWYDATEDLNPSVAMVSAESPKESVSEDTVLCVPNLPSEVTESDVMLLFEKYHPSGVSICTVKNNLRIALVTFNRPEFADKAVAALNGSSLQGQTLHMEHQSQASASGGKPEYSTHATKPQTSETVSASLGEKITTRPALSSAVTNNQTPECPSPFRISASPTANGICVQQHFGTMASLDILMPELMRLHPDVGRHKIVQVLMELMAKHRGALTRLPLETIRQMTSDLLTRPASSSWS